MSTSKPFRGRSICGVKTLTAAVALGAVGVLFAASAAKADFVSTNTGSLGAPANGSNTDTVTLTTGVVAAGTDKAVVYNNTDGAKTSVTLQTALNPPANSPFTIEFWGKPTASDNDDAPVANRVSSGNRSGWAFFQRAAATGWNFRMYNGSGSATSVDITGGTATLNAWSHVVATWDGSTAQLYVNGSPVAISASGAIYNVNSTVPLTVGGLADATGTSPYNGAIDEVAFYASVLTPTQILNHFNTVSSLTPNAYFSMVRSDGALLQLSNLPEPTSLGAMGLCAAAILAGRRRRTQA